MNNSIKTLYLASILTFFGMPEGLANGHTPPAPAPATEEKVISCPCCYTPNSGNPNTERFYDSQFYAGAQGGYEHQNSKLSGKYTNGLGNVTPFRYHSTPDGVVGELFVGKRFLTSNCVMFGVELGGVMSTNKTNKHALLNNQRHLRFIAERRYAIIPSLVFGYVFSPRWMVYGRAGAAFGGFWTEVHDDDFQGANLKKSHHKNKVGFAPAIGVECGFTSSMSARAEFGGEIYGTVAKNKTNLVIPGLFENVVTKYSANFFNAKIGVIVKF